MLLKTLWILLVALQVEQSFSTPEKLHSNAVTIGIGKFSSALYQPIANVYKDENLVSSPISANLALAMTSYGARGNTKTEMRKILHMPSDELSSDGYEAISSNLLSVIHIANKIYVDNDVHINKDFEETVSKSFKSEIENINLSNHNQACENINTWISNNTDHKITKIVNPDDLQDSKLVLLNAVYFKGVWKIPFDLQSSKTGQFHVNGNEKTEDVTMMNKCEIFNYGIIRDIGAKFIELPFDTHKDKKAATSLVIILPNKIDGLADVERKLSKVNFISLLSNGTLTPLDLHLPKFKVKSTLRLKSILSHMGMSAIFRNEADFTGIAQSPPMKIGRIIQKAFIGVDEKGTEAAAATAVTIFPLMSLDCPEVMEFKVDRPFSFAIIHIKTKTVLFQGHVTKPVFKFYSHLTRNV